jgi:hypothetical protein
MNAQRRRQIKRIRTNLIEIQEQIESVRDDEQEAFDSMPEPLQMSERGEMN